MSPLIRRHGSDAGPAYCSRSPSRQSGRASNRARMSCVRRLKRVFDLDIEQLPELPRCFFRGHTTNFSRCQFHGSVSGSGLNITIELLPILG